MAKTNANRWESSRKRQSAQEQKGTEWELKQVVTLAARAEEHDEHVQMLRSILADPLLNEARRVYYAVVLQWLERQPHYRMSLPMVNRVQHTMKVLDFVRSGKISQTHSTAKEIEHAHIMAQNFLASKARRQNEAESKLAPFLRDPSLLPKRPPGMR